MLLGGGPRGGPAIARYTPDGKLDAALDGDGIRIFDGPNLFPRAIAVAPDDKIVLVASLTDPSSGITDFEVLRLLPDGQLDPSFSEDGRLRTDFDDHYYSNPFDLAIDAEGNVVVAGNFREADPPPHIGIVRITPEGTLDVSFSGDGKARLTQQFAYGPGSVMPVAGSVYVAFGSLQGLGQTLGRQAGRPGGARSVVRGQRDRRYLRLYSVGPASRASRCGRRTGRTDTRRWHAVLGPCGDRLRRKRLRDPDAGERAAGSVIRHERHFVRTDNSGRNRERSGRPHLRRGSLRAAATYEEDFSLTRLTPNGVLDPRFSEDGSVSTDFEFGIDIAGSVLMAPDGKVVLAGLPTGARHEIARYETAPGPPDADADQVLDGNTAARRGLRVVPAAVRQSRRPSP